MGDALQKRMEELTRRQAALSARFSAIAEGAALRAVEEAQNHTPPNTFEEGELRGVHMITGAMAQHWETDSQTVPVRAGSSYMTALANNQEYASYVNDGHRLDKHFVPGLYVDGDGLLSRDPGRPGGMMVGTKTSYVPGLYMKEKAVEKVREVAEAELRKLPGEVFR